MAKRNKTSKTTRHKKTKTRKLKGGSTSGLLHKINRGVSKTPEHRLIGSKVGADALEKTIEEIEKIQEQNLKDI